MTEEQKQALIEHCEKKIKELSKVQFGIMHKDKLDLLICCQALASLTATPVKLPKSERLDCNGYGYYFDMNHILVALEDAGIKFEVQE